jgi:hypothetical protein
MCTTTAGAVDCVCQFGFISLGGDCEPATSCDSGACDPLSTCTLEGHTPVCGGCPTGYSGTGDSGCVPLLSQLDVGAGGTLIPAFSANVTSYRVQLPLPVENLHLSMKGPSQAQLQINETKLDPSGQWTSPVLPLGEHPIQITLASSSGTMHKYELVVEHAGKQDAYLKARVPEGEDTFGVALAMSGDTLAIGATSEDGGSSGVNGDESSNAVSNSGAVYVFVRDGAGWSQQAYLKADVPTASAWFGKSVALEGDTLIIGEPRASPFANTNVAPRAGSIYVFTRSVGVWTRTAVLKPDAVQDTEMFGFDMAISNGTLVIGAPFENTGAHHSGAIYVASRSDGFSKLTQLKPQAPQAEDVFGWSVAVDNNTVVVGAIQEVDPSSRTGPGRAYVFAHENDQWVEKQTLLGQNTETGASFGFGVAVLGERIAVGAPRARISSVMVPRGETFVFERTAGTFALSATLTASHPADGDFFGSSVALAPDGVLACALGDGSGARGLDGDDSRRDSFQSGAFYLFGRSSDRWEPAVYGKADNAGRGDQLGYACRISGHDVIVSSILEQSGSPTDNTDDSASGAGAVYVFH